MTGSDGRARHPRFPRGLRLLDHPALVARIVACEVLVLSAGSAAISGEQGSDRRASASVSVGATVIPSARLELGRHERLLTLKPEDVTRGYVEVVPAMSLVVRTNGATGYFLDFQIASDMIWGADIFGLTRDAFVGCQRGRVLQPTKGPAREELELGFRFHLSENAAPGVYPWPVSVTVTAITR
jgi:hypothetical protein